MQRAVSDGESPNLRSLGENVSWLIHFLTPLIVSRLPLMLALTTFLSMCTG